ncbi:MULTISPECIES: glycerate kinase [unclassified Cryobacterium]|uniref:glycerate kinase n=1 Tax=unclassified Cryobacterium TaxID=2649013 RepID=UPI0010695A0F|nr:MULTISPECIES: glycerate kinase [unclassified Cryobacterium]TFC58669.1 glycerate kinase [Cryobacterium sp. TMB3-1-2]TFC67090.1 glycerate kinase [Cryobacterium sp. TMB3-15]TFC73397.1 glycerate kinase [Cryobacterium sp. TMB3-10]TFD44130.1 glycerate kinase [Cryobacterium sp. TMB3-12]
MKFVLAPDSFKESMTAPEAVAAMRRGVLSVFPDADCVAAPMADGGEGTTEALTDALDGVLVSAPVHDALGRSVRARYGYVGSEHLAIIEIAAAAGIDLVAVADRDPKITSSYGVGELIRHALDRGATRFIVGLGGSVTNDGGAGMLEALGARLLDEAGADLPRGGAALARLHRIDLSAVDPRLAGSTFQIASDVTNPLLGAAGASAVFGPQKGADPATVHQLDAALGVYATVIVALTGTDVSNQPGAGAAGGLGAAFLAFFPAELRRGVDVVMDAVHLADRIAGADFVFTGEGSLDAQTLSGKTPLGVAEAAGVHGVPVVAFAGRIGPGAEVLYDHGFAALVPILPGVSDLPSALADGAANLERAVATVCRLLTLS